MTLANIHSKPSLEIIMSRDIVGEVINRATSSPEELEGFFARLSMKLAHIAHDTERAGYPLMMSDMEDSVHDLVHAALLSVYKNGLH
jgi:hypothetical protein